MSQEEAALARQRVLQEAQEALLQRRAALQEARTGCLPDPAQKPGFCQPNIPANAEPKSRVSTPSLVETIAALPHHVCWENTRVTAVIRAALRARDERAAAGDAHAWLKSPSFEVEEAGLPASGPQTVDEDAGLREITLYPDLALAILRRKLAGPGRVWHLLRALDGRGRGWVGAEEARAAFTGDESPLRFCGKRQLGNLLAQGEGIFWTLADGRVWLRAPARVALALGLTRLTGRPVAAAVSAFTGGIAAVRAQLYASFHSGRKSMPVARRTLAAKSGVAPRTQRSYDRAAKVGRAPNFARGPRLDSPDAETLAWQKGPACFKWTDTQGKRGSKGAGYLAWQLPNSYEGPHPPRSRGAGKRTQRRLADLLTQGTTGNDQQDEGTLPRTFFANPRAAAQAYGRAAAPAAVYWPETNGRFWSCLW